MPELICNTSPLQYLHQLGLLHLIPSLVGRVVVPSAVARELSVGRTQGIDLPIPEELDWITIRASRSAPVIPLVVDLGAGETEVLALALESGNAEVLLDDALARRVAAMLAWRSVALWDYCSTPKRQVWCRRLSHCWIVLCRWVFG